MLRGFVSLFQISIWVRPLPSVRKHAEQIALKSSGKNKKIQVKTPRLEGFFGFEKDFLNPAVSTQKFTDKRAPDNVDY